MDSEEFFCVYYYGPVIWIGVEVRGEKIFNVFFILTVICFLIGQVELVEGFSK